MSLTTIDHTARGPACHDDMHVDGDSCPTCNGWLTGCHDEHDVDPADRVTSTAPFTVDRTITGDDIHLVTVALTDDAAHTHVRDIADLHIRDFVLLSRLRQQERKHRQLGFDGTAIAASREARRIEDRLAGALTAHMTTQWELTLTQAEQLLEHLEDAATDPEPCSVGTCTGYAAVGGYCGPHADGI